MKGYVKTSMILVSVFVIALAMGIGLSAGEIEICMLEANYVQTSNNDTCQYIITNGYNWTVTEGYTLLTTEDLIINGTNSWLNGGNGTISLGSLTINSGGVYNATSGTTTISSTNVDVNGTYTGNSGILLVPVNLNVQDSGTFTAGNNVTVSNQTLVVGTFNAGSANLTLGSGYTANYALQVNPTGTFNGGTGTHTIGTFYEKSATVTFTSGVMTLDSAHIADDSTLGFWNGTFDDGDGTIMFTGAGNQLLYEFDSAAKTLYNVIVNKASGTVQYYNGNGFALTVANDLTITSGTFDTEETITGTDRDLTVTGDVDITGTLDGNAGAMSFGSLTINSGGTYNATSGTSTIGWLVLNSGGTYSALSGKTVMISEIGNKVIDIKAGSTFSAGSGSFNITTTSTTDIDEDAIGNFNDLIIDTNAIIRWIDKNLTIQGNLTINKGYFISDDIKRGLEVYGDLTINNGGTLGDGYENMTQSFRSVNIFEGGTLKGTSNVLYVTGNDLINGNAWNSSGNYTHNGGTVHFQDDGDDAGFISGNNPFYKIIIDYTPRSLITQSNLYVSTDVEVRSGAWTCGSTASKNITVNGDVTLTGGNFNGASWLLNFGSLNIGINRIFDSTNNQLNIGGHFDNYGTFTHNEGFVNFTNIDIINIQEDGTASLTFYDLGKGNGQVHTKKDITIINSLNISSGGSKLRLYNNMTLTGGNSTQSATFRSLNSDGYPLQTMFDGGKIYGASEDYPIQIYVSNKNAIANWGDTRIKWINIIGSWRSSNQSFPIYMDGNVEMDSFNITYNDTFYMRGYNLTVGGKMFVNGKLSGDNGILNLTSGDTTLNQDIELNNLIINSGASFNITAGYYINFNDTENSGFLSSDGTLNVLGNSTDFAYIQTDAVSPINRWTIDGDLITVNSIYARIRDGNSTGSTRINIDGQSVGNNEGLWNFTDDDAVFYEPVNVLLNQNTSIDFDWEAPDLIGDITNWFINVWDYVTNDLIKSWVTTGNETNYTTPSDDGIPDGHYNWSVIANRSYGNDTTSPSNGTFKIDVEPSTITYYTPSEFVVDTFVSSMTMNVSVLDTNLYGTNVSILYSNGTSAFYDERINLASNTSWWTNSTGQLLPDTYDMTVCGSDDHTNKKIVIGQEDGFNGYDYILGDTKVKLYTDSLDSDKIIKIKTEKLDDRITEEITMVKGDKTIIRYVESNSKIYYRKESKFIAHFVTGEGIEGMWIDFENDDSDSKIKVTKISDYKYKIEIKTKKDKITFKSIGGINVECKSTQFIINNTLPVAVSVGMLPVTPIDHSNLIINATCYELDPEHTLIAYWNVYKDNINQTTLAGSISISNNTNKNLTTISYGNTTPEEIWNTTVFCIDSDGGVSNTVASNQLTIYNTAPNISTVTFNDGVTNRTNETMYCNVTGYDAESTTDLSAQIRYYNTTGDIFFTDTITGMTNNTEASITLGSGNTTKGITYWCSARVSDGNKYSAWLNSTNITILDTSPEAPSLLSPLTGITITSSIMKFNWTAGSDLDPDYLTYILQVSNTSDFAYVIKETANSSDIIYNYNTVDLTVEKTYYWRVKTVTDDANSTWSSTRYFGFNSGSTTYTTDLGAINHSQDGILLVIIIVLIASAFFIAYIGFNIGKDHKELQMIMIVISILIMAGAIFTATMLSTITSTITVLANEDGSITQTLELNSMAPIIEIAQGVFNVVLGLAGIIFLYFTFKYIMHILDKTMNLDKV